MTYQLRYHSDVKTDLGAFPKNIKTRIKKAIEGRLQNNPWHYGDPLRKSLQGYRRLRVGDYRIIYKIEEDIIVILKIGHRKEVYEQDIKKRTRGNA